MIVLFHKTFAKKYVALPRQMQKRVDERMALFIEDSNHPILHKHALKGERSGQWSFNITGDYRIVYEELVEDTVRLLTIGTHSELYE